MISATGAYTAPMVVPSPATFDVTATSHADPTVKGTAPVTLATAHPAAAVTIPNTNPYSPDMVHHHIAINGTRAYAVWVTEATGAVNFVRSDDAGATFKPSIDLNDADKTVTVSCESVAVDPVNPDVVYVAYRYDAFDTVPKTSSVVSGNAGTTVALAVSTDGGSTFTRYVLYSGEGGYGICMDLVAPAKDAVLLSAPNTDAVSPSDEPVQIDVWRDLNRGAAFANGVWVNSLQYRANGNLQPFVNDGLTAAYGPFDAIGQNGGSVTVSEAPRLFTDGKGNVCVTYIGTYVDPGNDNNLAYIQCSADSGATFSTPPVLLDPGDIDASRSNINTPHIPVGNFGPNGAVAVTWFSDLPSNDRATFVATSADGGKTFGAPIQVNNYAAPMCSQAADGEHAHVLYEGSTLWLAYHAANAHCDAIGDRLIVDKSCDGGKTWSGTQLIDGDEATMMIDALGFPAFFLAPTGIKVLAFEVGSPQTMKIIPLEP
jgi:hypothetical protein